MKMRNKHPLDSRQSYESSLGIKGSKMSTKMKLPEVYEIEENFLNCLSQLANLYEED